MSAVKMKLTNECLIEKCKVIRHIEKGTAKKEASRKIWSAKNTISMRTKNKEKPFSAPQATLSSTRKICNCNYKEEGKAVYDWFILRKSQLIPIDDALIKEEARFRQKVLNLQTSELHMG